MQTGRYANAQIIAILRQAKRRMQVAQLTTSVDEQRVVLQMAGNV